MTAIYFGVILVLIAIGYLFRPFTRCRCVPQAGHLHSRPHLPRRLRGLGVLVPMIAVIAIGIPVADRIVNAQTIPPMTRALPATNCNAPQCSATSTRWRPTLIPANPAHSSGVPRKLIRFDALLFQLSDLRDGRCLRSARRGFRPAQPVDEFPGAQSCRTVRKGRSVCECDCRGVDDHRHRIFRFVRDGSLLPENLTDSNFCSGCNGVPRRPFAPIRSVHRVHSVSCRWSSERC